MSRTPKAELYKLTAKLRELQQLSPETFQAVGRIVNLALRNEREVSRALESIKEGSS